MLPTNLLVPIDFSEGSVAALDYASELATKLGATIHLVHCLNAALPELQIALTGAMIEEMKSGAREGLEKLVAARSKDRFGTLHVAIADPREGIVDTAKITKTDLIVMGTHGRSGLSRIVLGSVAESVVRHAPCPVLTVSERAGR